MFPITRSDATDGQRTGFRSRLARRRSHEAGGGALLLARRHATLSGLERLIEVHGAATPEATAEVMQSARRAAASLLSPAGDAALAYETFVASALAGLAIEAEPDFTGLGATLDQVQQRTGVDQLRIALRAVADPAILELPLDAAAEACVLLIRALAPVRKVALWHGDPASDPRSPQPMLDESRRRMAAVARRAKIFDAAVEDARLEVATITCWRRPCGALVWIPEQGYEGECAAIAERAAALLGPAYERASLTEGNVARSAAVLRNAERRLTRLGFDLHDGPLQDIALVSGELAGIRERLIGLLGGSAAGRAALARIDDLAGLVSFLDGDLRELAVSLDSPSAGRRPFDETVHGAVRSFSARTSIEPTVELSGDFGDLTDSQRIAMLRIVQESLTNVRDHSDATEVRIAIRVHRSYVEAVVEDNGCGFAVEEALRDAAQRGRMGLLGMVERIRMLGGACNIRSHPGVGTTISLTLARWVPAAAHPETSATAASA